MRLDDRGRRVHHRDRMVDDADGHDRHDRMVYDGGGHDRDGPVRGSIGGYGHAQCERDLKTTNGTSEKRKIVVGRGGGDFGV